jgi:hypothetical protein
MDLNDAIEAIQQPRSRYQLEQFVVGQHDTLEMQFYQCVIELNDMIHKYKLAEISQVRMEREIARLEESDEEDADLDLTEKKLEYEFFLGVKNGGEREIVCLLDIYDQIPHFSRDEIEHAQPEYWQKRLTRQTNLQMMSGNVQWAQLDSMRQIGLLDDLVEAREAQIAEQVKLELAE